MKLVELFFKVENIYNDLNNLIHPQDIFEKTKNMFNDFVSEFDSAKKNILGVKFVGEREPRVGRCKKLSKIQSEINKVYKSLNNDNSESKNILRKKLKCLESQKEKLIKDLESKEYSKFLDQLDKLDVANRASLFYNEYFKSFKSKSSNISGVIKDKSGVFSKCEQ